MKNKTPQQDGLVRFLDEEGNVRHPLPELDAGLLLRMYRNMVHTRLFDERAMMLQRQGRIGFFVPSYGEEATQTATAAVLDPNDWAFPSYRNPGVFLYRGAGIFEMFCNLFSNEKDLCLGRQMPAHYSFSDLRLFSISSPIATQVIQAVGAAMAFKLRKQKQCAITYFGDGGTSENDFHTGMTFAGAYCAPVVFVCTNNQYAISMPVSRQCGARRLADKALGYGFPGVAVDGNDVLAVYVAAKEAVERAREGKGPTMLECVTMRMGPHSSSDDPTRYRDQKITDEWKKKDPIERFRKYLTNQKLWSDKKDKELEEQLKNELVELAGKAEKVSQPTIESLFDDVYEKLTPQLEKQRGQLLLERDLIGKFENSSESFPL
ncbi:MAG: pyruvate dehydrogenase (acetyl-transferring) E1 component subunit alpha [Deltaproteobacteria bacterium]|nr:pyruvate dehydrogenase (acetyl-transferring) E1 component subunit alpha [Deltaproteobacteria bacterium]